MKANFGTPQDPSDSSLASSAPPPPRNMVPEPDRQGKTVKAFMLRICHLPKLNNVAITINLIHGTPSASA